MVSSFTVSAPKSSFTDSSPDGVSVYAVLEKGLEDLMAMCDVVEEKFTVARDDFVNKMQE
jgi:DNA-directed RNA polymerase I and III subunit RPAC2